MIQFRLLIFFILSASVLCALHNLQPILAVMLYNVLDNCVAHC